MMGAPAAPLALAALLPVPFELEAPALLPLAAAPLPAAPFAAAPVPLIPKPPFGAALAALPPVAAPELTGFDITPFAPSPAIAPGSIAPSPASSPSAGTTGFPTGVQAMTVTEVASSSTRVTSHKRPTQSFDIAHLPLGTF